MAKTKKKAPAKLIKKIIRKPIKKPMKKALKNAVKKAAPAKRVRKLISSGSAWEPKMGYSRAVRLGDNIHVSGTTDDSVGDLYGQSKLAIQRILNAVAPEGARAEHVVRTRIFVTDISKWEEVARAHGEIFGEIRPATTIVEVSKLIAPSILVEIEADFCL